MIKKTDFFVVGILNITPDSFSDGGLFLDEKKAVSHIERLIESGADMIDIGAASSRPHSKLISVEEEMGRLKPVLGTYFSRFSTPVSLDTYHSSIAEYGLSLGVSWINDITAMVGDPNMSAVISSYGAGVILMHMQGIPETMQVNPVYDSVVETVLAFLSDRVTVAKEAGIRLIMVDPGIGFGKTLSNNINLISASNLFLDLGCPVMLGPSRKRFIEEITGAAVDQRLGGTISACLAAYQRGVRYFRVHDVFEVRQALQVFSQLMDGQS